MVYFRLALLAGTTLAAAGAMAADLGVKKPTAVEYVKTCPQYGAGFFVVPGTTSCLKMVGRVRFDYGTFADPRARTADMNTFRARGYIGYDHRTATEYGLLRTYTFARFSRDNAGAYGVVLEHAFIQFGGLTVGRFTPVFETGYYWTMGARPSGNTGIGGSSDLLYHNQASYTFAFNKAFSATVSIASQAERRQAIVGSAYAGQAMPDIVGRLDYKGSWGEVMAAGAVHQIRATNSTISTRYGYAATLGARINLSAISKGSRLFVMGTYAEGANNYTGFSTFTIGQATVASADAIVSGTSLRLSKTWGLVGGVQVFVAPTVYVGLTGGYSSYDPFGGANTIRTMTIAGNIGWQPVSGFLIGGEVNYRAITQSTVGAGHAQIAAGTDKSSWTGRVRFQRSF